MAINPNEAYRAGYDPGELSAIKNLSVNPNLQSGLGIDGVNAGGLDNSFDLSGAMSSFGSAAKGVGGLVQAWQGLESLKLAKDQLKTQNRQWEKNYQAQRDDVAYDRNRRAQSHARMYS